MPCEIEGIEVRDLKRHDDDRGWLVELFRQDEVDENVYPVMSYVSLTRQGVVRGPHEHREQTDLLCFVGSSTFRLYLWDNRNNSSTSGKYAEMEFGENHWATVIIPPGVVHAYKNIGSRDGLVYNAPNRLYAGEGHNEPVDEIRHENDTGSKFHIRD
ncbi:MAG: dTDP-4-dehydrorhamnose 3,5-epimerase family protein [candidate division Zixibacteria bacterium]|nr:dTDP-4-dehydrorhamnose 3,5-epimerase family protein [candidate division Zixibacteria bacterium]